MGYYARCVYPEGTDEHLATTNGIRDNWCDCAGQHFGATK